MLDPSKIPFTPVSFILLITYSVYTFWSSSPCIDDLEVHLSALRWTVSFVESFMGALKSLDTTGPSPLLRLQELPLSWWINRSSCNVCVVITAWVTLNFIIAFWAMLELLGKVVLCEASVVLFSVYYMKSMSFCFCFCFFVGRSTWELRGMNL